jgi:hypothetical protein
MTAKKSQFAYNSLINRSTVFLVCSIGAILILLLGCEKKLELNLGESGGKPVLFTILQPDSGLSVSLTKSVSILSVADYEFATDAVIEIYRNGKYHKRMLYPSETIHTRRADIRFNSGDTIRFDLFEGNTLISQPQTTLPATVPIEEIDTVRVLRKRADGVFQPMMRTRFFFSDPKNQANYYQIQLFYHYAELTDTNETIHHTDTIQFIKDDRVFYDPNQGSSSFEAIDFEGLFTDSAIDGQRYGLTIYLPISYFNVSPHILSPYFHVRLYHVNDTYYHFMRASLLTEAARGLPIYNQVKIPSNIPNGYGILSAIASSSKFLEIKQ